MTLRKITGWVKRLGFGLATAGTMLAVTGCDVNNLLQEILNTVTGIVPGTGA